MGGGGDARGASGFPPSLSNLGVVITTCPDTHAWTGSADASSVLHQIVLGEEIVLAPCSLCGCCIIFSPL